MRYLPVATIGVLVVAGYLVLSRFGLGVVPSAQAQVNVQRIGESVAETITEEGSKTSLDVAAEQAGEEAQQPSEAGIETVEFEEGELPPGESAEPAGGEGAVAALPRVSSEGVGGPSVSELSLEEMRSQLVSLPDTQGNLSVVNALMPILRRFQAMVSPPWSASGYTAEKPPWDSGARRYSPFDSVGTRTPTGRARVEAIPPFPGFGEEGPARKSDQITSEQFAGTLTLRGVVGEVGNYRAILSGAGEERQFGVGDEIVKIGESVFVVKEITMNGVRIENTSAVGDEAFLQFVERRGITDISISY